ncbi:MAG: hypothetical protein WAV01_03125, partial [Candidatus Saccharimonadales bacterium]
MTSSRRLPLSYNEKTFGTLAAGRDYTVLATWESDTDNNLVSSAKGEVLTCYADLATYNNNVMIAGATTNGSYFRVIRAASGQRGTPTIGVRFENNNVVAATYVFTCFENNFSLYDLGISVNTTGSYSCVAVRSGQTNIINRFVGLTIYNCTSSGGLAIGLYIGGVPTDTIYVGNCYITNCTGIHAASSGLYFECTDINGTNTGYVYNNTITYCKTGVLTASSGSGELVTLNLKNNIIQGCTTPIIQGSNCTIVTTTNVTSGVTFAADGYHLAPTDTVAINHGTDLSGVLPSTET